MELGSTTIHARFRNLPKCLLKCSKLPNHNQRRWRLRASVGIPVAADRHGTVCLELAARCASRRSIRKPRRRFVATQCVACLLGMVKMVSAVFLAKLRLISAKPLWCRNKKKQALGGHSRLRQARDVVCLPNLCPGPGLIPLTWGPASTVNMRRARTPSVASHHGTGKQTIGVPRSAGPCHARVSFQVVSRLVGVEICIVKNAHRRTSIST